MFNRIRNVRRLSRKPSCTCNPGPVRKKTGIHLYSCDLMYKKNDSPIKKKKRLFFFYPMKTIKDK